MSWDLVSIRKLIEASKKEILSTICEIKVLKNSIEEEIKEIKEWKEKVITKDSINYEKDNIENKKDVKVQYDEEKQEKDLSDVTFACDEGQHYLFKYFQILFHCDECPEKFTELNGLRTHKRTHTELKVNSCIICQKLFMQKGELDLHKKQSIQLPVKFEQVEGRSFVAKQKQNFIFKVF